MQWLFSLTWSEPQLKKMCFIWATCREKGSQNAKSWARTLWKELKPSVPRFASMRSHPYIKIIWRWSYTCFSIFEVLQQFGKIGYQYPDFYRLLILIFSTFRTFNYYSIMRSMNYFGQVFLEILENNYLKSYFGSSEIEILSTFLQISERWKLNLQNHIF